MHVDVIVSTAMFAVFIWAARFMVPKAVKTQDPLAIAGAALTALLSLIGWLMIAAAATSETR